MRTFARRVAVVALTAGLVLILALPASADQIITYRGETSQAEPVILKVLKRGANVSSRDTPSSSR